MSLSTYQWHQRYQQQARWTQNLRQFLYDQVGIQRAHKILDIGCGTGVLENELNQISSSHVFGLDIDFSPLRVAMEYALKSTYTVGDGLFIPFQSGIFDITMCHFLLLWVGIESNAIRKIDSIQIPYEHRLRFIKFSRDAFEINL